MIIKAGLLIVSLIASISGFAGSFYFEKLKCFVDTGGINRVAVPVTRTMGSIPESAFDYNGNKIAIGFNQGNKFESQQVLAIGFNGYISQIYDPKDSLYKLTDSKSSVTVQCRFEK